MRTAVGDRPGLKEERHGARGERRENRRRRVIVAEWC